MAGIMRPETETLERIFPTLSKVDPSWRPVFEREMAKPYFAELVKFLTREHATDTRIFPPRNAVFQACTLTPLSTLRVVILGQDPYHGVGQATGLAFSVDRDQRIPPSLRNIYKELEADLQIPAPDHGDLTGWARQGVLLLNTVLTVRESQAHSHANQGWEVFTDALISEASARGDVLFLLWGKPAQNKSLLIDQERNKILASAHPSPLSAYRGFFGCRHFCKVNEDLAARGLPPIDWTL
jgi:uracil-DNA glycosylase